jgi:hypothetical protein
VLDQGRLSCLTLLSHTITQVLSFVLAVIVPVALAEDRKILWDNLNLPSKTLESVETNHPQLEAGRILTEE